MHLSAQHAAMQCGTARFRRIHMVQPLLKSPRSLSCPLSPVSESPDLRHQLNSASAFAQMLHVISSSSAGAQLPACQSRTFSLCMLQQASSCADVYVEGVQHAMCQLRVALSWINFSRCEL